MNSLSWLLYLINLIDNFEGYFKFITIISFIVLLIVVTITHITAAVHNDNVDTYSSWRNKDKISHSDRNKIYRGYIWIPFVLALIWSFIPNNRTMYLIAASEIGERVVSNEKVQGLVDPSIDILKNYVMLENEKITKELNEFRNNSRKK